MANEKTFKTDCPFCKKPFHIRAEIQQPSKEGDAKVAVDCQYCGKDVMVTLPKKYVTSGEMAMMLKSTPAGED